MLSQLQGWNRFVPLILQLLLGGIFIPHGAQKLFGTFGGSGMTAFTESLQKSGITPAVFWAWVVACLEFFGGLFVFFGFLTRIGAALFVVEMIVAIVKVNWARGFFWLKGGLEFPLVLAVIALAVLLGGPSFLSVDRAVGLEKRSA
jgi:putative oxidoreductase